MSEELELKEILEATINGVIRWQRVGENGNWRFEAEFKGWKLTLKHRVKYTVFGADFGTDFHPGIRYDDWALTMQNEELRKARVAWESHYTEIWDGFNEIRSAYSTHWHYQQKGVLIGKMAMETVDYKALDDLFSEACLRAS